LILIDGPSAAKGGRWGFLRAARDLIGDDTVVILDDTHRQSDRELADAIAKAFGMRKDIIASEHPKDFGRSITILHPACCMRG
jgi:predicted kinase